MSIFRIDDEGLEVLDIQERLSALGASIDDIETLERRFGSSTDAAVREFQRRRRLRVDGLVGPDTWGQLVEAGYHLGDRALYLRSPLFRGDDVRELQRKLNSLGFDAGKEDGLLGPNTTRAVREFQLNVGHGVDGIVGPETVATLDRMRPLETGPGRAEVREREQLRGMRASVEGQVIAIDSGRAATPADGGGGEALSPASISHAMGEALAAELAVVGAKPWLLADNIDEGESDAALGAPSDRARAANELGASACISLYLASGLPEASGPTCSYFGGQTSHSPAGMLLAQLILSELEAEFGSRGRLQRLSGAMLGETRMPAVQVEPLSITNQREAELLADPAFAMRVGRAVGAGVRRFFSGEATEDP